MSTSSSRAPRTSNASAIRRRTALPFILDEVIDSIDMIMRGAADGAMDVVNLKISKFGGLTRIKQARDLCVSLGIAMTLEDSWGGDIVTAAIAHLAHSTPPEFLFTATDFNSYVDDVDRRWRAQTSERPHGGVEPAGAGGDAQIGRAWRISGSPLTRRWRSVRGAPRQR